MHHLTRLIAPSGVSGAAWESIELTPRQLGRLARHIRRYRRQIHNHHLLFWVQRTLVEQQDNL